MTKLRAVLLAATFVGAAAAAHPAAAQQITGLYLGAGIGGSLMSDQTAQIDAVVPFAAVSQAKVKNGFDGGLGMVASVGYGVGNGVRLEIEGSYRNNQQTRAPSGALLPTGNETKYGVMGNVLYDIDTGLNWIYPYVGIGLGYQESQWNNVAFAASGISFLSGANPVVTRNQTIGELAYQAIVGLSFPIEYVPGLSVTAEYRYMALSGNRNYAAVASFPFGSPSLPTKVHATDDQNHTFLLGVRYAFNALPSAPPPEQAAYQPAPAPPPVQSATRTYIVFFDFDRADLTPRARDIVAEAVRNSARVPHTRIEVSGNADRSGTDAYNQRLSQMRADAVAAEMERWGVPRAIMDIHAYGDTHPLVPTAAGVREPQNRRVEIVYR